MDIAIISFAFFVKYEYEEISRSSMGDIQLSSG